MKIHSIFFFIILTTILPVQAENIRHGDIRADNPSMAWDRKIEQWVTVEQFWLNYAQERGGITWGRSATYPEFRKVREHDTFMVRLASGPCLMEFFHTRWRRANDVRRWDPLFTNYGGCSDVFK